MGVTCVAVDTQPVFLLSAAICCPRFPQYSAKTFRQVRLGVRPTDVKRSPRKDCNISPRKNRDANTGQTIRLSKQTVRRLEKLRDQTRKGSIADVVEEAIEVYTRLRPSAEIAAYERLTPRLREVLTMIGEGSSTKEIAYRLKVSLKTVEFHRTRLMKRLEIYGVAGLVRYAIRVGAVLP
jgi:DNA-binding NarL/FixJ family response regulator